MLLESIPPENPFLPWELPQSVVDVIITEALHRFSTSNSDGKATEEEITCSSKDTMEFPRIGRASDLLGSAPDPDFFRQARRIDPYREDLTKIGHGAEYQIPQDGAYLMANDVWGRPTPADFWGSSPTQHHKSPFVNHIPIDSSFLEPSAVHETKDISVSSLSNPAVEKKTSQGNHDAENAEIFHFRMPMNIVGLMQGVITNVDLSMSIFKVTFPRNLVIQILTEAVTALKEDENRRGAAHIDPDSNYAFETNALQEHYGTHDDCIVVTRRNSEAHQKVNDDLNTFDSFKMTQECPDLRNETANFHYANNLSATDTVQERDEITTFERRYVARTERTEEMNPVANSARMNRDIENTDPTIQYLREEAIQQIRTEIDAALEMSKEEFVHEIRTAETKTMQGLQEVKAQIECLAESLTALAPTQSQEKHEALDPEKIHGPQDARASFVQHLIAARNAQTQATSGEPVQTATVIDTSTMRSVAESYVSNLRQCVKRGSILKRATPHPVEEIEIEIQAAIKSELKTPKLFEFPAAVANKMTPRSRRFFETWGKANNDWSTI
ncbi:hypothetical protein FisN_23Lh022 [Fistulifera solaris]|uniref:Uncharacterized protein n=1 Tax=Fistulifera solaris TaxID=1519565 RepID=A0A1Z5KJW6_FISSO|nr:hypothetical protein FisN_23Lh022 [Fistulifera solaris]|eukprot:GAX26497.1 hypothetical protein FisN_23Lh022 [Fistulifera solaris]